MVKIFNPESLFYIIKLGDIVNKKKVLIIIIAILLIIIGGILLLMPIFFNNDLEVIDNNPNIIDITLGLNSTSTDDSVKISNNNIYLNKGGIYNISGILNNGTIYIDTNDEVTLNLNNVTITNQENGVIDNRKSKKVIINLREDSNNILSDGKNSTAAIKSVGDLFIEGSGKLLVYANKNNGINTNGNLVINGGTIYITAKNDAFNVLKELLINSGFVIGLGNNTMKIPNELSKQSTFLFNFNDTFSENTTFSLTNNANDYLLNFVALRDFKTLILSHSVLKSGTYHILRDIECSGKLENGVFIDGEVKGGERINIGIADTFAIDDKSNWYGKKEINITNPDNFV